MLGGLVGLFGLEEGVRALLATIFGWYVVPGWTSLMILTSVIGCALLTCIGILGQYVGQIFEQSKERPLYLVARTFNVAASNNSDKQGFPAQKRNIYEPGRIGI